MILVRIELDNGSTHEWGTRLQAVPEIGDTLWLYYELPGEERTGNWVLEATVTKRRFPIDHYKLEEVWLTARSTMDVPDGFVADSPEWPSDNPECYAVKKALARRGSVTQAVVD